MADNVRSTVEAEFEALRRREMSERDARVNHAVSLDREIATLMSARLGAITRAYAQALRTGTAPDKAAFKDEYQRIDAEIRNRLLKLGLPGDYLELRCNCPICGDRGYVGDADRRDCECFKRRLAEERLRRERLDMAGDDTFDKFDPGVFPDEKLAGRNYSQREFALRARDICLKYCAQYPNNPRRNLILTGGSGLGKTFLVNCMANELQKSGVGVCYLTAYRMLGAMRENVIGGEPAAFDTMVESDVLIIDDLGSEPIYRNITVEMLFTLMNERARTRRHTIIATNLSVRDMVDRYGDRVASRLTDQSNTQILPFEGRDLRSLSRR